MKKLTVLLSLFGLMLVVSLSNLSAGIVFAQTETDTIALNIRDIQNAETVTAADLGVSDPGLLPTNPFYFLKEFGRNVQRVFTFNSVSKTELELKITNEKAAEVKKIQEIVPNDNVAIIKGLENYKNAQENLKNRLESLNISSTTPGIDKLLNNIAVDSVLHQKVLDEIGAKTSDSAEVKNIIDLAKERMDESIIVAAKENPINFTTSLENAFIDSRGSEFKYIRSLEIIDRLQSKIPEEARSSLNRLRENFSDQLGENIKTTVRSSNSEVVQRALSEIPGDAIRKAAIIDELKAGADFGTISTLEGVSKTLEKEYLNEQDLAQKAEGQLKFVRELMKKLEERMSRINNGIDIKSNIEVAKNHLQKAETAFSDKKYGEVIGQSRSVEAIIRKSLSLFEEKFVNLEGLSRQVKELYSKINSYAEMLNARKITVDSNPKVYEALSNAKMHAGEAEKYITQNSIPDVKKHIAEARASLESIFKLIDQNTTIRVKMPAFIDKPIERAVATNTQAVYCGGLKKDIENISEMLKFGLIKEDEYKLKYENLKQQLEKCIVANQPATNSVPIIKPIIQDQSSAPVPALTCASANESLYSLEKMFKEGSINEVDYALKRENIKLELDRCTNAAIMPTIINKAVFRNAYWQCYDEKEQRAEDINCRSWESWQMDAKKFCEGHCYVDKSKCGVNSFSVTNQCQEGTPCTQEYNPVCGVDGKTYSNECTAKISGFSVKYKGECDAGMVTKEECGKENEKVNRDPLAGPVIKQCCYGLKEDRASKYYSICIKPLENAITDTANIPVSTGMANPASIYCVSKGYKNVIKSNAGGSQYGVCIFNDGSECEEWKFYKGECREGGSSSLIPSTNTTVINPVVACPVLAPISPNAERECAEKGGKLITEKDANGCYLAPRCILPSNSNVVPAVQY